MSALSTALSTAGWQAGFLHLLPAVETHAKFKFRRLPAHHREEAIQEAIASACVSYQLLAAQGRLHTAHPSTLAAFAVQFVCNGRHVGGHQDAAQDVMSPACQRRRGVRVRGGQSPELNHGTNRGWEPSADWRQVAIAGRKASIPDTAAFRIDFAGWLKSLSRRDRRIITAFIRGDRTAAVAERFGLSAGRVSQLRRHYEAEWRAFQGEPASEPVSGPASKPASAAA